MPKVFVDCDGVLSAFSKHVQDLFGVHPDHIPDDELWELVLETPDFWSTIPVKYGAHDLWALVKAYDPIVLTGCPRNHFEVAAAHKIVWIHQHFGADVPVITCHGRDKASHMDAPGDILIDDFSSNVRRWIKAGGVGVYYRNYEQAMADFKLAVGFDDDNRTPVQST